MGALSWGLTIGLSAGVLIGVLLTGVALLCLRKFHNRRAIGNSSSRRTSTIPIRTNGEDTSTILSDSTSGMASPRATSWLEGSRRRSLVSASGVPKYPYKYVIILENLFSKKKLSLKTLLYHSFLEFQLMWSSLFDMR